MEKNTARTPVESHGGPPVSDLVPDEFMEKRAERYFGTMVWMWMLFPAQFWLLAPLLGANIDICWEIKLFFLSSSLLAAATKLMYERKCWVADTPRKGGMILALHICVHAGWLVWYTGGVFSPILSSLPWHVHVCRSEFPRDICVDNACPYIQGCAALQVYMKSMRPHGLLARADLVRVQVV